MFKKFHLKLVGMMIVAGVSCLSFTQANAAVFPVSHQSRLLCQSMVAKRIKPSLLNHCRIRCRASFNPINGSFSCKCSLICTGLSKKSGHLMIANLNH